MGMNIVNALKHPGGYLNDILVTAHFKGHLGPERIEGYIVFPFFGMYLIIMDTRNVAPF